MFLFVGNPFARIRYTKTYLILIFQCIGKCDRSLRGKLQGISQKIREYLHDSVFVGINHDLR